MAIGKEIKTVIPNFNSNKVFRYACAVLFLQNLDEIYEGRKYSSINVSNNSTSTSKLASLPYKLLL